jgi:hypothetical protein
MDVKMSVYDFDNNRKNKQITGLQAPMPTGPRRLP